MVASAPELQAQAQRYNQTMERRVRRWKWTRAGVATAFAALGFATWALTAFVFAVPLFGAAAIMFVLYLVARDHLREIKGRNWQRLVRTSTRTGKLEKRPEH